MKRALVLGGGGIIGVAWESGLLHGLSEAGFDPRQVDVIVGTSAGAITGSMVAAGMLPPVTGSQDARRREGDGLLSMNRAAMDPKALGFIFSRWMKMTVTTPAEAAEIGKVAATLHRELEAQTVASIARLVDLPAWPERRLLVNAVDTLTGERRVFDRDSDVPLAHAVAASSAVPGIFSSVTIDGRLYMDGQVHSSTNVDALLPDVPELVLVAMPTNSVTSPGIGGHAERMLEAELAALKSSGARVTVRMPLPEHGARLGTNLMDAARAAEAFAVGREVGQQWASELR
jgi:NTE family protein